MVNQSLMYVSSSIEHPHPELLCLKVPIDTLKIPCSFYHIGKTRYLTRPPHRRVWRLKILIGPSLLFVLRLNNKVLVHKMEFSYEHLPTNAIIFSSCSSRLSWAGRSTVRKRALPTNLASLQNKISNGGAPYQGSNPWLQLGLTNNECEYKCAQLCGVTPHHH